MVIPPNPFLLTIGLRCFEGAVLASALHWACSLPVTLARHTAARLWPSMSMRCICSQVSGDITYNGKGFDQFQAVHTTAYLDQNDLHIAELTVRETFDFAARCQGIGHKGGACLVLRCCPCMPCLRYGWLQGEHALCIHAACSAALITTGC